MSVVVIPSIGASSRLKGVVLAACGSMADEVMIIENQSILGDRHKPTVRDELCYAHRNLMIINVPGLSLHGVWNLGLKRARSSEFCAAVLLNDDVEITSMAINMLIEALMEHDDYAVVGANYDTRFLNPDRSKPIRQVFGTYRHHGIGGFAFACRADRCHVDEQFEWWGGDDDIVKQAMADGWKIGLHEGAPVLHPEPETTAILFPELLAAKDRDRERMRVKWNDPW